MPSTGAPLCRKQGPFLRSSELAAALAPTPAIATSNCSAASWSKSRSWSRDPVHNLGLLAATCVQTTVVSALSCCSSNRTSFTLPSSPSIMVSEHSRASFHAAASERIGVAWANRVACAESALLLGVEGTLHQNL